MDAGGLFLPGAATLLEQVDRRLLVVLRDGRHLMGVLRTFDQYLNLVLEETVERLAYRDAYCDVPVGLFLVRGDNVVVLGELDEEKEAASEMRRVSHEEISAMIAGKTLDWDFE